MPESAEVKAARLLSGLGNQLRKEIDSHSYNAEALIVDLMEQDLFAGLKFGKCLSCELMVAAIITARKDRSTPVPAASDIAEMELIYQTALLAAGADPNSPCLTGTLNVRHAGTIMQSSP